MLAMLGCHTCLQVLLQLQQDQQEMVQPNVQSSLLKDKFDAKEN